MQRPNKLIFLAFFQEYIYINDWGASCAFNSTKCTIVVDGKNIHESWY